MPESRDVDVVVIGAGIVGLATAAALVRADPSRTVCVLEKESRIAAHQTGRNSGVIHSGIYYRPGSAKAALVARGRTMLIDRLRAEGIAHEICGKVVVATDESQLDRLARLEGLAGEHGIDAARLTPAGLREIEPHAVGVAALSVPSAGIVDYREVCASLLDEVRAADGALETGRKVTRLDERDDGVSIHHDGGSVHATFAVNCAGLFSDRVVRAAGAVPSARITPFRGEYHELTPDAQRLVRHLIYPVPDPAFPFLGVHLTRMLGGGVHAGPNAVLALSREGYRWRDVDRHDLAEMARDPGLRRLAAAHWRTGLGEVGRSLSRRALARALRRLVPEIGPQHLVRAPAGVRAQALAADGHLLDDFEFVDTRRIVHVVNAPSPAATASLAIGEEIARRVDALPA